MSLVPPIETAFVELGGSAYLVQLGKDDPKAFINLLAKLLPHEIRTTENLQPDPVPNLELSHEVASAIPKELVADL